MKTLSTRFALGMFAGLVGTSVLAEPAGKVLFAQAGTEIVNEKGEKRPAKRGDQLESGERLLTPAGAITQVLLPDGSLVGMRPGSEVKLDTAGPVGDKPGQVISLVQGSLRVIGSELMDAKKLSALTVQTGLATLKLSGADLESAVVKPTDVRTAGVTDAGSYSRLLVGTGTIGSGALLEPLVARQTSFVGPVSGAPIVVASVSPNTLNPPANLFPTVAALPEKSSPPNKTSPSLGPLVPAPAVPVLGPVGGSPVVKPPTLVPAVPVLPTMIAPTINGSNIVPVVTKAPVITTIIKTCTNVIIGGKKVCI